MTEKKQVFYNQYNKVVELLNTDDIYDYITAVKYAYGFVVRYKSVNLKDMLDGEAQKYQKQDKMLNMLLKGKILKPYNDTYWFDKELAEQAQDYIRENRTN